MEEVLVMSNDEIERIKILSEVIEGKITQITAAKKLKLSDRQIRRLITKFKNHGNKSVISKKRGKKSNRQLPNELKSKALYLIENHYIDFGPKLANEYLNQEHGITISTETLRLWMIEKHLWIPKSKTKTIHSLRQRRAAFGELIQIDGSHHDWFEGRSPRCVLMVFIDDATSTITSLHFSESESLEAYYYALAKHLKTYGIPLAFYGDRCATLNSRSSKKETTQFQRALKELNCELILALSPQAKGRVERVNRTLQDRLVKEMRLKGISNIEEANAMLDDYRERHNKLFSKKPSEQTNVHRSLEGICLEHVLCTRETRTLNNNVVQFKNNFYKISNQDGKSVFFRRGKIEIRQLLSGKKVGYIGKEIFNVNLLEEAESSILDSKEVLTWRAKQKYIPPKTHPYKIHHDGKLRNAI
jgi:transposase InsO family protein